MEGIIYFWTWIISRGLVIIEFQGKLWRQVLEWIDRTLNLWGLRSKKMFLKLFLSPFGEKKGKVDTMFMVDRSSSKFTQLHFRKKHILVC